MFYKMCNDAENGNNNYVPIEVHWSEVPGRDKAWQEENIKNIGNIGEVVNVKR